MILLLPETRQAREFRREFTSLLATDFPIGPGLALRRLGAGFDPGGNGIITL